MGGPLGIGVGVCARRGRPLPWLPRDGAGNPAVMWRDHLDGRFYAGGAVQPNLAAFSVAANRTFTRSSTKTRRGPTGGLESVAINVEALDWAADGSPLGLSLEMPRTNLTQARKHNPTDTTNVQRGSSELVLSVVNDAAALAAAGLSGICSNGQVYKLDNSAAGSENNVVFYPTPGSTAICSVSAYVRGTGTGYIGLSQTAGRVAFTLDGTYRRVQAGAITPVDNARVLRISVAAGGILYVILPGIEAGSFVSSVIAGGALAAETRAADLDRCIGATEPFPGLVQGQGALVWEGAIVADQNGLLCRLDNTASGGIDGLTLGTIAGNVAYLIVTMAGVTQAGIYSAAGSIVPGTRFRMVGAWESNRFELWLNGAKIGLDTSGAVPTFQRFGLGRDPGSLGVGSFCHFARGGYLAAPPWDRLATVAQIGGV